MGSNKILTPTGWIDTSLREKVTELLLALQMDEGLPMVRVDGYEDSVCGPIDDENVVRILLELAGMVNVGEP